jgi:hypothetical protein
MEKNYFRSRAAQSRANLWTRPSANYSCSMNHHWRYTLWATSISISSSPPSTSTPSVQTYSSIALQKIDKSRTTLLTQHRHRQLETGAVALEAKSGIALAVASHEDAVAEQGQIDTIDQITSQSGVS